MTEPLQTASVEIVTDFSGFARELEIGVRRAFAALQPQLLKATRQIGTSFEAAASDAANSLDQVARAAGHAGDEVGDDLKRGGEKAERALKGVANQAERSLGEVRREAARADSALGSVGRGITSLGPLLIGAGVAAAAGLGAVATFGLRAAAAQEQSLIALESLLGGAKQAKTVFADLQKFAATTPFELPQILDVTKRFLTFSKTVGLAQDQLIPFLTTVGNIASVTGSGAEGMSRVALALGQIASKGKLSLEELGQISEALPGFSGIAAIAAAKGITTAEAMKAISAGTIGAKEGVAALIKGMAQFKGAAGAMEKQAQTLLGLFSTFKDDISAALISGFDPVIPELKKTLADLTPIIKDAAAQIAPLLGGLLATLGPLLGQLVQAIVPILLPIIDGLGKGLAALGPALVPLGQALGRITKAFAPFGPVLGDFIAKLVEALIPAIDELTPSIDLIVEAAINLLTALLPLIPSLGELAASLVLLLVPLVKLITVLARDPRTLEEFSRNVVQIANAIGLLAAAFTTAAAFINNIDWDATGRAIVGAFDTVVDFFGGIGEFIVNAFNAVVDFFQALPGRIGGFLASLPGILINLFKTALDQLAFAVGFGIGKILRFFIDLPGNVTRLVSFLWATVTRLFQLGVNRVVAFFTALPGRIAGAANRLVGIVKSMVDRAVTFVSGLPGRVASFISGLPGRISSAGSGLFSAGYELARSIVNGLISGFRNLVGNAFDNLLDLAKQGLAGVKAGLGIGSPSKVFAEQVGVPIGQGIALGIREGAADLTNALTAVTSPRAAVAATAPAGVRVTPSAAATGAVAPRVVLEFRGDGTRYVALLIEELRRAVQRGGGNVQTVLGVTSR